MRYLSLSDCIPVNKIDRTYYAYGDAVGGFSAAPSGSGAINENRNGWRYTGNQNEPNSVNGWAPPAGYTDAIGKTGSGASVGGNIQVPTFNDVLGNAQSINQAQIQANQPGIATLGGAENDLVSRYSDLLDTIKGQGSVAVNAQTLASNNALGARGITSDSALYQQQLAQSLLPVTAANQSAVANLGVQESQNLLPLTQQIASLQTGNLPVALSAAGQLAGAQYGFAGQQVGAAAQIQSAQLQTQAEIQAAQIQAANNLAVQQLRNQTPFGVAAGGQVYNPATGGYTAQSAPNITSLTGNSTGGGGNTSSVSPYVQPLYRSTGNTTQFGPATTNAGGVQYSPQDIQSALNFATGSYNPNALKTTFNYGNLNLGL